jgi:hypothetical protein
MNFPITQDPVLRTYCVKFLTPQIDGAEYICYDVSGFFGPIAIRDQIVRACSVVDRAIENGIISRDRPLLIIGAGHAGVASAITAVRRGIPTVLVEKEKQVLERLDKAGRYVSLLQYDWSAEHWKSDKFPWHKSYSIRVRLKDGQAGTMTGALRNEYKRIKRKYPRLFTVFEDASISLEFIPSTTTGGLPMLQPTIKVNGAVKTSNPVGMGLSCTGFNGEKVSITDNHPYCGYEYWRLGKYDFAQDGTVLIGGSGDGALQDFLLLTTNKKSAKEIYLELGLSPQQKLEIEEKIFKAEEQLKRDEIWLNKKSSKKAARMAVCALYKKIHDFHLTEVTELLKSSTVTANIDKLLQPNAQKNITLAHMCLHFEAYYGLNRFLALLIGKRIEKLENRTVFIPNCGIKDVRSAATEHTCQREIDECVNFEHSVTLIRDFECSDRSLMGSVYDRTFDYVLLRFGLNGGQITPALGGEPSFPGLQIIPNTLP